MEAKKKRAIVQLTTHLGSWGMRWHSAIENTPLTSSQIPPKKWDVQGNEQTELNLPLEQRCKTNYGKRHFGQLRERTDGSSQNTLGELKCQLGFPKAFWMEWLSLMCLQGTLSLRFLQTVEKNNQIPNPVNLEACIEWNTRDFCMMLSRMVATKSYKNWSGMRSLIPVFELWLRVDFKPHPSPFPLHLCLFKLVRKPGAVCFGTSGMCKPFKVLPGRGVSPSPHS